MSSGFKVFSNFFKVLSVSTICCSSLVTHSQTPEAAKETSVPPAVAAPADIKTPPAVPFNATGVWDLDIYNQADHKVLIIQDRKYTKAKKIEVGLNLGITKASAYFNAISYGVLGAYHFDEYFGIEAFYNASSASGTREKRQLDTFLEAKGLSSTFEVQDPQSTFGANLIWSPIYGKFAFFRRNIIHFDIFAIGGFSVQGLGTNLTSQGAKEQNLFGSLLGVGTKVFLSKHFSLRLEAKNNIYRTYYFPVIKQDGSGDIQIPGKKVWWNAWHYLIGTSYTFGSGKSE